MNILPNHKMLSLYQSKDGEPHRQMLTTANESSIRLYLFDVTTAPHTSVIVMGSEALALASRVEKLLSIDEDDRGQYSDITDSPDADRILVSRLALPDQEEAIVLDLYAKDNYLDNFVLSLSEARKFVHFIQSHIQPKPSWSSFIDEAY